MDECEFKKECNDVFPSISCSGNPLCYQVCDINRKFAILVHNRAIGIVERVLKEANMPSAADAFIKALKMEEI